MIRYEGKFGMAFKPPVALLFSAVAMSLGLLTQVNAEGELKASLQAVYTSRDASFVNKDVKGTLAPYAADVVIINADGDRSKGLTAQSDELSKLFASNLFFSSPTTEVQELVADKTGREATIKAVRHITVTSKPVGTDQTPPSVVEEVVRDHWAEGENGWHITQERRLTKATLSELCSAAAGKPVEASIVGKWVGHLPSKPGTTAQMTVEFTADGKEQQTIVAPRQNIVSQATYVAQGGVLTETLVGGTKNGRPVSGAGQVQVLKYRIVGDTLFISLPGSSAELQFARQPD